MNLDLQLFYVLNNLAGKSHFFDRTVIFFADYLQYTVLIVLIFTLFFQEAKRKEKYYFLVALAISTIIARLGIVNLFRFFYHRPRPFMVHEVNQLLTNLDWSFPSGHATVFFAVAFVAYKYNKRWGAVLYVVSFFITISRIIGGIHYPSDILGGLLLGSLVSYIVINIVKHYQNS